MAVSFIGRVGTVVFAMLLASACTQENPLYCDPSTPCAQGACDFTRNACAISLPCESNSDCDEGAAPICGKHGVCRGCGRLQLDCAQNNPAKGVCELGGCRACSVDLECPSVLPNCNDGVCSPCEPGQKGNSLCSERGDPNSVCRSGACVECEKESDCSEREPVCDGGECRACARNDECESKICSDSGACVPQDQVLFVAEQGQNTSPCGTSHVPCATIAGALAGLSQSGGPRTIAIASGNYREQVKIDARYGVAPITLIGADDAPSTVGRIIVDDGAEVHLSRISVDGGLVPDETADSSRSGVICDGRFGPSELYVNRVNITGNDIGIYGENCARVVMTRSMVVSNDKQAIYTLKLGDLIIENSVFVENGKSAESVPIFTLGGKEVLFRGNSVFNNGGENVPFLFSCSPGGKVANVISRSNSSKQVAKACAISHSLFDTANVPGRGNKTGLPLFYNESAVPPDLHLSPLSPAVDAGMKLPVPGSVDFDGTRRTLGAGPDMGAFEAK